MSEMERLANLFAELKTAIAKCSKCGMCQSVCPLYGQTKNENDVARGKLALLDAIGHQMFDQPEGVLKRLNRCLLCGSCAANCPNGVDALAIFLKARTILSEFAGLSWIKKFVFKKIVAEPKAFEKWTQRGTRMQKWIFKPENEILGTVSMRFSSVLGQRHFLPLSDTSFEQLIQTELKTSDDASTQILFYPGCLINHVFPNIGLASYQALSQTGSNIRIPDVQICCGMPAVSAGDAKTAKNLILQNLEVLSHFQFDQLITACPTCAYAIKKIWPMMVGNMDMGTDRNLLSTLDHVTGNTLDISQFIFHHHHLDSIQATPNPDAVSVTYHDPCHLKKSLGVHKEPRALILANPGYRLKEMRQPDQCCGMGGSFGIEHYALSNTIGEVKLSNILATRCNVVASGCPACMMQLSHLLSKSKTNIAVKHPIEIYVDRIGDG